ncbi:hypothetical protein [Xenorhabdus lircayensis]|nr:hypothetical protein [Xenorhabdus lircayensis]
MRKIIVIWADKNQQKQGKPSFWLRIAGNKMVFSSMAWTLE